MKKAKLIRQLILIAFGFVSALIAARTGLTTTESGELDIWPFVILLVFLIFVGSWLGRNVLEKWIPD